MIDIFITNWKRPDFLCKTVDLIHERTAEGSFQIHVYDNQTTRESLDILEQYRSDEKIVSYHIDSRNTGCLYNKAIFHAMTESSNPYYVVTDNDVYPPKLTPDWLVQMVEVMDSNPRLAFLTPQLPPQWLQEPIEARKDYVRCRAVGNTFKLVRRAAYPIYAQKLGEYGDDGMVSAAVGEQGWEVGFCRRIFCFHAGQCEHWGYKAEDVFSDPRKEGYGPPYEYEMRDMDTYEPVDPKLRM